MAGQILLLWMRKEATQCPYSFYYSWELNPNLIILTPGTFQSMDRYVIDEEWG